MRTLIPPIKCQGIKTKLIPTILGRIDRDPEGLWIEPFLGSGAVVLNVLPKRALLADTNPHLIRFYQAVQDGEITGAKTRQFLECEGDLLSKHGQEHYYFIRDRFNSTNSPLDFLFLNRSCFNGVIRFNKRGKFNVPFGHKPQRFAPAYVTKIVNQVTRFNDASQLFDWQFVCQDFNTTIQAADSTDFIYCDPPYVDRHVDYYHNWDECSETQLHYTLKNTRARFMLSTWHSNQHRENHFLQTLWSEFTISTQEHFYHVGARETNRKPMLEALITNYGSAYAHIGRRGSSEQLKLLEEQRPYLDRKIRSDGPWPLLETEGYPEAQPKTAKD